MSTAAKIRQMINSIDHGQLFSTRKFLALGSRGAVDQALYFLVKIGEIVRVARGVFMKRGSAPPTILAVAQTKAAAFGKRIFRHGADTAPALGFPVQVNENPTFACNGRSSSFRFGEIVIRFIGMSPRKLHGEDELTGQLIRAMWHLGKKQLTQALVASTYPCWSKVCPQLQDAASMLPAWMNNHFYWSRPGSRADTSGPLPPLFIDPSQIFPEFAEYFDRLDQAAYP